MIKTIFPFLLLLPIIVFSQQKDEFQNTDTASLFTASVDATETTNDSHLYNFKKENSFPSLKKKSVYEWKWKRDGIWTAAGLSICTAGLIISNSKSGISIPDQQKFLDAESLQLEIDKIDKINRWAAGNNSESARSLSDLILYTSLTAPIALLLNKNINNEAGEYIAIYIQSLATSTALYTLTARFVDKSRPFVYDNSGETSNFKRFRNNGQRSFYSGHVAATSTATFFAAKTYCDFNPDIKGKGFIWAGAATIPAAVAYFRIEAGQHFLTDVAIGYALGATCGILVPELHKKKYEDIEIFPSSETSFNGDRHSGLTFKYTF